MKLQEPTLLIDPGQRVTPVGPRSSSRQFAREAVVSPMPYVICGSIEFPVSRSPTQFLDFCGAAVDPMVEIPLVRGGFVPENEHQGWNIAERWELGPYAERRYVIELLSSQTVSVRLNSSRIVQITVCDDDDYGAFSPDNIAQSRRTVEKLSFRAPRTSIYDVVIRNPTSESVHVAIWIVAAREEAGEGNPNPQS